MIKEVMYMYLGTNGTICSKVHLEDVYYIRKAKLTAEEKKLITKDGINLYYSIVVPEEEAGQWYEIDKVGQE